MISLFILYSPDRKSVLETTIYFLKKMSGFQSWQKIICCDGKSNIFLNNFEIIEIPRKNDYFCWASAWSAAISISKHEIIWYLDSDRIVSKNYVINAISLLKPKNVIYPTELIQLQQNYSIEQIEEIVLNPKKFGNIDNRFDVPQANFGKNPFSGNVIMFKSDYIKSGGVDPCYCGWGFPDTDYFMSTFRQGFKFIKHPETELHLYHNYSIKNEIFKLHNLWNGCKFAEKWNITLGDSILIRLSELGINPNTIVKFKSLDEFINHYQKQVKVL